VLQPVTQKNVQEMEKWGVRMGRGESGLHSCWAEGKFQRRLR